MKTSILVCCLALALAEKNPKRGIGPEAFARPQSQDTRSAFNLQGIIAANQQTLGPAPYEQFLTGYQTPYIGQHDGFGFSALGGGGGYSGGYSHIPPQVAPQQKPAQLALAAAAAVAQQNFGHPAYGQPPRQDPQAAIIQNANNQLSQLPQYQEYNRQLQEYARQPIALNYGNTQIRAYPPPPQPTQQPNVNTFQGYGQGQRGQGYYAPSQPLFQPAPAQSNAISYAPSQPASISYAAPQPTAIPYAAPQPTAISYAAPQPAVQYATPQPAVLQYSAPSYGLQAGKGPGGAVSYSSFSSGGQLTTDSGFRPIHP